ncbi:MAG: O-phosphoserine--tRNA ligase [Candidatus Lokiarchaeota archaeon]|nr:O-phosphoserine--tRNA ligase [Candidatus Lokiarchaeota archaeon]
MVKFDTNSLLEAARRNYERAWNDSAKLLEREGTKFKLQAARGSAHPIYSFIQEARQALVSLGFEEIVLPIFVDEEEIYKEYGPEAALITDRIFYTAELPRPDIGISQKKMDHIKALVPKFDKDKFGDLQKLFKAYKKNEIEADDFLDEMVAQLGVSPSEAADVIDKVFPEFKNIQPIPSKRTLRSHTTALWFPVLGALQGKKPLPIQLFHVGLKFRREQKLDARHLYESNTMSLVICHEHITLKDCMDVAGAICKRIGFQDARFEVKKTTGKYYAPGTEFEIFVKHENYGDWLEIGDGGFYSPVSCAKYGIAYPTFNIGFGVERIVMIKTGSADIRQLAYPYFYAPSTFSDKEIAALISIANVPSTDGGKAIAAAIAAAIEARGQDPSPCTAPVGDFAVGGGRVHVDLWQKEDGVKLVGKALFNEVFVKDGEINCFESSASSLPDGATKTGIKFVDSISSDIAFQAERLVDAAGKEITIQYKVAKKASDVNVAIDPAVVRFVTDKQRKIKINGPVFVNATVRRG